jgi:hypothetical protein
VGGAAGCEGGGEQAGERGGGAAVAADDAGLEFVHDAS